MLGLLGTVYGMIEVFEVLAVLGTGNPRAMSTGVAKATIPTMAGMTIRFNSNDGYCFYHVNFLYSHNFICKRNRS